MGFPKKDKNKFDPPVNAGPMVVEEVVIKLLNNNTCQVKGPTDLLKCMNVIHQGMTAILKVHNQQMLKDAKANGRVVLPTDKEIVGLGRA